MTTPSLAPLGGFTCRYFADDNLLRPLYHSVRSTKPEILFFQVNESLIAADGTIEHLNLQQLARFYQKRVTATFSGLGDGSERGWLCATMIPATFNRITSRNTSPLRMSEVLKLL